MGVMRNKSELLKECKRVNELLKTDAINHKLGTQFSQSRLEEARHNDAPAFSYWAGLEFQEFCRRALEKHPALSASYLINNGARLLKISPVTTKRYLAVLRSAGGPLMVMGDTVMINPNYTPPDQDGYWIDDQQPEEQTE